MALVYADRVRESSATSGTGTLNLAGSPATFQTFTAGIGTGNTCYYAIVDGVAGTWEVGTGTVTAGAPATLSRSAVYTSSNANALVNFAANAKDVYCVWPAHAVTSLVYNAVAAPNVEVDAAASGYVNLGNANGVAVQVTAASASTVNYLQLNATAAAGTPSLSLLGTDTDIGINVLPKGAGSFRVGATSGANAFIFRKDNSGTQTVLQLLNSTSAANSQSVIQLATGTAGSTVNFLLNDNNGTPYFQISTGSAITTAYWDATTQLWRTQGGGSERMRIDSSGRLLIGYTADVGGGERLQLNGAANFALGLTTGASSTLTTSLAGVLRYTINNTSTAASSVASVFLQTGTANSSVDVRVNDNGGSPTFQVLASSAVPTAYVDFDTHIFRTRAGTEKLRFDSSSRLLLGYASDQGGGQQLQMSGNALITGNLTVNGTLNYSSSALLSGDDNLLVNGGMDFDQRYEGVAQALGTGTVVRTGDQWVWFFTGVATGLTCGRNSTTPPVGHKYFQRVTIGTGSATVNAGDNLSFAQNVEGQNCIDIGFGAAGAQPVSISFLVRSSITGTFSYALRNAAANRSRVGQFTIVSANTWTQINIPNLTGDVTGTWANDTTTGLSLTVALMAGSTYSTASTAWQAANVFSVTGSTNLAATTGATFDITAAKIQMGAYVTTFLRRKYPVELLGCQRYFFKTFAPGTAPAQNIGINNGEVFFNSLGASTTFRYGQVYPVPMRVAPTLTFYNPAGANANLRNESTSVDITIASSTYARLCWIYGTTDVGGTAGSILGVHLIADAAL